MKLCLIGCGFIGSTLAKAMENMDEIDEIYVTDKSREKAPWISSCKKVRYQKDMREILDGVDLVIEAASQQAVRQYATLVLEKGKNILIMSIGALADDEFRKKCRTLAQKNKCRIYIPTGALCGIDGLNSASMGKLYEVSLTSKKPVKALKDNQYLRAKGFKIGELEEPQEVFEGSAKDAVKYFPKTSNVAATLSLTGLGFEKTKVRIVADPKAKRNTHEIRARGEFGELKATVNNEPSPTNPKTSILAALSAISGLKKLTGAIWVGL